MCIRDSVKPVPEVHAILERLFPALVGQRDGVPDGGVVESKGGSTCNCTRHVGHAIVYDAIDHVSRFGMCRRMRCLETSALVNRHIDDHRALLHTCNHLGDNQLGRSRPPTQHATDNQFSICLLYTSRCV